jgi:hypothetical protein
LLQNVVARIRARLQTLRKNSALDRISEMRFNIWLLPLLVRACLQGVPYGCFVVAPSGVVHGSPNHIDRR